MQAPICPDDKHPHAIDLGLPSGTLWSCCNLGAHDPDDPGDVYQYGTIVEVPDDEINDFYKELSQYSDIAGTKFDVAREKWGGDWQIPSEEQIVELLSLNFNQWSGSDNDYRMFTLSGYKEWNNISTGDLKLFGNNQNYITLPSTEFSIYIPKSNPSMSVPNGKATYWLSTNYDNERAKVIEIDLHVMPDAVYGSSYVEIYPDDKDQKYYVRPVMKKK